jgi:acetyl-CoA carboxylase carboxyl transferase subunit alpha
VELIGVGDVTNIFENGVYSVISPEGCAAILWKDASLATQAASSLKLTALELKTLGVVDHIVPEPEGGAHQDWDKAAAYLSEALKESLAEVGSMTDQDRIARRYERFRRMGAVEASE